MIGLDGLITQSDGFRTSEPLEYPQLHPRPDPAPAPAVTAVEFDRLASVLPILDDEDDVVTVEVEVAAGPRAGGGGGGGGGEDVSEVEVVLSADERKRARISHGGIGTGRRMIRGSLGQ